MSGFSIVDILTDDGASLRVAFATQGTTARDLCDRVVHLKQAQEHRFVTDIKDLVVIAQTDSNHSSPPLVLCHNVDIATFLSQSNIRALRIVGFNSQVRKMRRLHESFDVVSNQFSDLRKQIYGDVATIPVTNSIEPARPVNKAQGSARRVEASQNSVATSSDPSTTAYSLPVSPRHLSEATQQHAAFRGTSLASSLATAQHLHTDSSLSSNPNTIVKLPTKHGLKPSYQMEQQVYRDSYIQSIAAQSASSSAAPQLPLKLPTSSRVEPTDEEQSATQMQVMEVDVGDESSDGEEESETEGDDDDEGSEISSPVEVDETNKIETTEKIVTHVVHFAVPLTPVAATTTKATEAVASEPVNNETVNADDDDEGDDEQSTSTSSSEEESEVEQADKVKAAPRVSVSAKKSTGKSTPAALKVLTITSILLIHTYVCIFDIHSYIHTRL